MQESYLIGANGDQYNEALIPKVSAEDWHGNQLGNCKNC